MNQKIYGYIYVTTNIQTKKVYVGQKFGLPEKTNYYLGSGKALEEAILKYGKQFFKKRSLGVLEANSKKELKKILDEAEIESIYFYRSYGSDGENFDKIYGYNLTKGGDGTLGCSSWNKGIPMSKEARKKSSLSHKGQSPVNKGIPCSEEKKNKISKSNTGKKRTQEEKARRSERMKEEYSNGKRIPFWKGKKGISHSAEVYKKAWETRRKNKLLKEVME